MYKEEKSFDIIQGKVPDFRKCSVAINQEFNFEYSGNEQSFEVPCDGLYKLEVWGAQGGNSYTYVGGYGGYSVGNVKLSTEDTLYLIIGGQGKNGIKPNGGLGGYNGGGNGGNGFNSGLYGGGGGGGATHIATVSGLLNELEHNQDQILIVAGAGGGDAGSCRNCRIGHGGGWSGVSSTSVDGGSTFGAGNQSTGYLFGQGQLGRDSSQYNTYIGHDAEGAGGGGGGYYGGKAQTANGSYTNAHGAGGSGYIGNPLLTNKEMWCYGCTASNDETTKTTSTTCTNALPVANCSKQGDGYARITYLGK